MPLEPMRKLKIYIASSWRNKDYQEMVKFVESLGHEVLDWRNPSNGHPFKWSDISQSYKDWTAKDFVDISRSSPIFFRGLHSDVSMMRMADMCILLYPCGRSAHLEAGWFCGVNKPVAAFFTDGAEPELMLGLCDLITHTRDDIETFTYNVARSRNLWVE